MARAAFVLLLAACVLASARAMCPHGAALKSPQDFDRDKVTATVHAWLAATKALNASAVAALYADDGQQTDPVGSSAAITGRASIQAAWEGLFSLPKLQSYGCKVQSMIVNENSVALVCLVGSTFEGDAKGSKCVVSVPEVLTFAVNEAYLISSYAAYYDMSVLLLQLQKCCPSCA